MTRKKKIQPIHQTEIERNVAFMEKPNQWPRWPYLPVTRKNGNGFPEVGVILDSPTAPNRVYLTNLFARPIDLSKWVDYQNPTSIFLDGWRIN